MLCEVKHSNQIPGKSRRYYALCPIGGGTLVVVGAFEVVTYPPKTVNVALVPVNGFGTDISTTALEAYLNSTYAPANVSFKVTREANFDYGDTTKFFEGSSGLLEAYTGAMKKFNSTYVTHVGELKQDALYLFLMSYSGRHDVGGFMPRQKQLGYVFWSNAGRSEEERYRTVAHELGHGVANLAHTFDKTKYGIHQGSTKNLMDYSEGTELVKLQWDALHNPGEVWRVFERDVDGMKIIVDTLLFDKDDLKMYNSLMADLKSLRMFKQIYEYIDKSDEYVTVVDEIAKTPQKVLEILTKNHKYTNGYFSHAETKEIFWGFIKQLAGQSSNPHLIALYSSKNRDRDKRLKGSAFNNGATIFEEFFHAAHYIYLNEKGLYTNDLDFFTQTEVEVEIAQAMAYYIMKKENKMQTTFSPEFDVYKFVITDNSRTEIEENKAKFIKEIIDSKRLTDTMITNYKEQIIKLYEKKKESPENYDQKMDIDNLNWSFDFLKKVILDAYN